MKFLWPPANLSLPRTLQTFPSTIHFHSASFSTSTKGKTHLITFFLSNRASAVFISLFFVKPCLRRPNSQRCWREVRRCSYRTYKTLCENVPIKTCDPVKECKEKCGTVYYCDNCPSLVGPPSPPPAGTFIVGPPAPPVSRTPRKTSKDSRRRQIPRGPILDMQTP